MITVTESAAKKIKDFLADDQEAVGLRIYVKGGGCSGYSYGMKLEPIITEDDTVIEKDGIKVILDPQSAPMIAGAEVDYLDSLNGSGFAIKNPQAKTTCGCGSSFST
jgi:iron-sulfur cluster insertion protein